MLSVNRDIISKEDFYILVGITKEGYKEIFFILVSIIKIMRKL